jgi:alkanesulfonate monooxygenase SsuD/methylene tetrahydromethanopterin reductase-like flavin-dependent oxidoreductase (luciferase family)
VLQRFKGYAEAAGRDPATIGIECGMRITSDDDPDTWLTKAEAYRELGATHLRVLTAGGGFGSPDEHLDAAVRWKASLDRL